MDHAAGRHSIEALHQRPMVPDVVDHEKIIVLLRFEVVHTDRLYIAVWCSSDVDPDIAALVIVVLLRKVWALHAILA
eukprot:3553104-Heterocapsa_arctica.AAC.1